VGIDEEGTYEHSGRDEKGREGGEAGVSRRREGVEG
jgi:hypothetical protein